MSLLFVILINSPEEHIIDIDPDWAPPVVIARAVELVLEGETADAAHREQLLFVVHQFQHFQKRVRGPVPEEVREQVWVT